MGSKYISGPSYSLNGYKKTRSSKIGFSLPGCGIELITVQTLSLAQLLHLLALKGLLLPVLDGGRFLKVLPPLVLPDDTLFLNHAFETLNGLFKGLVFAYTNVGDGKSPPFAF
jgi:hypothetical protein